MDGVKNYNIAVKKRGDDITFLRKIVPGGADDSYGIEVAKLAGLPASVIRRAKAVLKEIETAAPVPGPAGPAPQVEDQLSLGAVAGIAVVERLRKLSPDTLSPIEALGLLYELCKQAKEG